MKPRIKKGISLQMSHTQTSEKRYYLQLCANKFEGLDEVGKSGEKYTKTLTQGKTENCNSSKIFKELSQ